MVPPSEKHFLYFSKKERRAICFLLFLVIAANFTEEIYLYFRPSPKEIFTYPDFSQLKIPGTSDSISVMMDAGSKEAVQLFNFDPNRISVEEWKRLGISEKTSAGIAKYISRGGRFKEKEDIKKVWGISSEKAETLMPYIRIEPLREEPRQPWKEKKQHILRVDINVADSSDFERLPGIGPKLSQRIINFRERLGGFYRIEQVGETYGLPDSTFRKLKDVMFIGDSKLRMININTATLGDFKMHPYIRYEIAKTIVSYRESHGLFEDVDGLKNLVLINEETFNKIAPYLTVQ